MRHLRVPLFLLSALILQGQSLVDKNVEVFGENIHYLEGGSGPTVILLHGLGGDASNWRFTVSALSAKYHLYVPDQIGFGQSAKPMINYRVQTLVDFLNAFCRKLEITKATLVGNSLGGWAAMAFTLEHPDKVDRLVLVDSAGYSFERLGTKPSRQAMLALNPSSIEGAKAVLNAILANKQLITNGLAQQFFTEHLKKNDGYTINAFIDSILRGEDTLDGKLGAIKVPTLIVWGREDGLTSLASGNMLHQDIAGSEMVVLEHCGHVPQLECGSAFNAALDKFLAAAPLQSAK